MSNFQIGQTVQLSGKDYKIVGTKARSFLLERDGKTYKATADKLTKIQVQDNTPKVSALQSYVNFEKLFRKDAKMPETEAEIMSYFDKLNCDLSPENLCCDGEASPSQIRDKLSRINAAWAELETRLGRKVAKEY